MIQISYPLSGTTPLYAGTQALSLQQLRSIARGDSSNAGSVSFSVHSGTHLDAPLHFCPEGEPVAGIIRAETSFSPAYCLDIPRTVPEALRPEDLEARISGIADAEAVLIRTGMCTLRDTSRYTTVYPWVDPTVPDLLRKHLPRLRLFGIDAISVSNPAHREEGRACHRNFLCGRFPIMILEDINLSNPRTCGRPWTLRIYPWILENIDATPVVALLDEPETDDRKPASPGGKKAGGAS